MDIILVDKLYTCLPGSVFIFTLFLHYVFLTNSNITQEYPRSFYLSYKRVLAYLGYILRYVAIKFAADRCSISIPVLTGMN